jgi:hypothetical protein
MFKLIFCFLFLVLNINTYSQEFQKDFLDLIPPSPNSSEFIKIIDIPVEEFTGIPKINIPIYTINFKKLKIPIDMIYSSNGIKVDQMSSWVGLGWGLDAGGVVTRVVRGLPDEKYDDHSYGLFYSSEKIDILNSNVTESQINYALSFGSGAFENEPDIFFFKVPGYSGKFSFDENRNIHLMPKQNIIINFNMEEHAPITSFTLVTPDGNKYIFSSCESTETNLPGDRVFNSSWYLTEIVTQYGNVSFLYDDEDILEKKLSGEIQIYDDGQWRNFSRTSITPEIRFHTKRLKKITWSGGEIVFYANQ